MTVIEFLLDDTEGILRSSQELERLKTELERRLWTPELLFDVDSIEAATRKKLRLEAEIKTLKDGFPIGSYQYILENEAMVSIMNEENPIGCYHLLDSTSLMTLMIEKQQVEFECQRRITFMNEVVEKVEILIKEKTD